MIVAVLLFFAALFVSACKEVAGNKTVYSSKEKTILVYMAANNGLSSYATENLFDMEKGYIPTTDGNLLVYYHIKDQNPLLLRITRDGGGDAELDTIYKFPAQNSAEASSISRAMKVTATFFPAAEYGLVLWSHGTGWLPSGYYSANTSSIYSAGAPSFGEPGTPSDPYADMVKSGVQTKSFASEDGEEMEITALAAALPYKLSFVIFDACLMGGIETAYQIKDSTDYVMFSPTEVLSQGFPYSKIMRHLFNSPTDLVGTAKEYYDFYSSSSGTISLIKTSSLDSLADAVKSVMETSRSKIGDLDMSDIQGYFRGSKAYFYDLRDFLSRISSPEQLAAVDAALASAVKYKAATSYFITIPININKFCGLSTYVPNPQNSTLETFYKKFRWNDACLMIE
jgi:hypothetical protein